MEKENKNELLNHDMESSLDVAKYIASVLDSKKARDIKLLYVEKQTVIADYFVICTGTSRTQIRALADEIDYKLKEYGIDSLRTEGMDTGLWVLKDYGSVIVHIFNEENRGFYKLEKLYDETTNVDISEIISEE